MLQIHNNLLGKKSEFKPIDPQNVRMYVCGMTVYDMCHIGHARMLVVFDVVYRYLCKLYGKEQVTYVRNITDIDDNIIARANKNNESIGALTSRYIDEMHKDISALGNLPPNEEPRATLFMQEIIDMIQTLVDKDFAYAEDNGDVYYAVKKFESYGKLSGKQLDDLRAGERVRVDESKRDPLDFVLWKAAKPDEPSWDSPWGKGRPGWHIECSAMSTQCLGHHFDIHGGGLDLQFPHHENEIAQSEAATGEPFVNVWMHNGFVRVDQEKMSKSLGNFFTIREVTEKYDPEVVRYFVLTSHYRSPLNYSDVHLDNAKAALKTLYTALRDMDEVQALDIAEDKNMKKFDVAMQDDFNTSEALSALFDTAREINKTRESDPSAAIQQAGLLRFMGLQLGILQRSATEFLQAGDGTDAGDDAAINALIVQREVARENKQWAESDRIRDELKAKGIVLEDSSGKTTWRRE